MELRQLKYFLKAKELLNFTEAARELFITQSTLSQQIKQLEEELGIPLFDRIGKRVSITEAGELFATYAEKSIQASNDGKLILDDLKQVNTGTLSIGLTWGLKSIVINSFKNFIAQFPHIKLQVTFGTTTELIDALLKQEIDFALTFYEGKHSEELIHEPIMFSDMAVIVAETSALAKKESINFKEVEQLTLALPVKGFSTRDFLDRQFEKHKIRPNIIVEVNYTATIIDLVRTGAFETILTLATVHGEKDLCAIPIRGTNMKREAVTLRLKDSYQKKAAIYFIDLLKTENKEEYNQL
ncbi:LysR substrate-binding domain-containing protein [Myroides fluvii]|uniref:LysR substrate-binding domain-containing protein n=1 Tax=Myroides fluvii TaxID=2572594 RepID=UPI00131E043B|nr:LysR substrate-binding domain-containing protein [Myroides fluvii]